MVGGGSVTTDVVPLVGAIVGGERDDQLWGSGRGAIGGCHCRVPLWCAMVVGGTRVTTNFGGSGHAAVAGWPWHPTQQSHPEKLPWASSLH